MALAFFNQKVGGSFALPDTKTRSKNNVNKQEDSNFIIHLRS